MEEVVPSVSSGVRAISLLLDVPGASRREIVPVDAHRAGGLPGDRVGVPGLPVVYVPRLSVRGCRGQSGRNEQGG